MSDVVVNVVESATNVTVTEQDVAVDVTETVVEVSASTAGVQGASYNQGDPIYVTVRNATGATLPKGSIVYISGANGNNVQVTPAIATSDATSARTLGWLSAAIANNASGLCQIEGYLEGLDTQGLTAGNQLYLSGTTAGSFTATKPQAPIHLVYVGVVTKVSAGDGHVFVKVQNGYELEELHDVKITSPANNDVLTYDLATDLWINKVNAADGVTSITVASPLTGGTITSTGTIGLDQTALSIAQSQVTNLVSDLAGKANLAGGNAITGAQTITSTAIGEFPLSIIPASGQTASTFRVRNAANNADLMSIDSSGQIRTPTILNPNSFNNSRLQMQNTGVFIDTGVTTNVPLAVRGASGQTENLQVWQSNAGSNLARISQTGSIGTNGNLAVGNIGITNTNQFQVTATSATQIGAVIRAAASQSADLLKIQNSAATDLGYFSATGDLWVTGAVRSLFYTNKNNTGGYLNYSTNSPMFEQRIASEVGLRVRGAASQTADLLQVQDSAGTNYLSVNNVGSLLFGTGSGSFLSGANGRVNVQLSGDNIGVTVRAFASQTAMLQSWQNSAGTELGRVRSSGQFGVGSLITGAAVAVNNDLFGATTVPLVIRAAASQTADLLLVQNSAAGTIARIDSVGDITARVQRSTFAARFTTTDPSIAIQVNTAAAGQTGDFIQMQNSGGTVVARVQADGSITGTSLTVTSGGLYTTGSIFADSNWGMIFRARTATPTNANYRWANSTDGELMRLDNSGRLIVSNATSGATQGIAQIEARTVNATTLGLTVTGSSAQTADLLLLRNNGLTTQFRVDPNGMTIANSLGVAGSPSGISYAYFTTPSASAKPVVIRGAASQTANLLEIQNSAGSILAFVRNDGVVRAPFLSTSNNYLFVGEQNGGGYLAMTKQTAAISNIGADRAGIYFRDGTTPGTLKLVVRAGAAGAETTILDNIPQ